SETVYSIGRINQLSTSIDEVSACQHLFPIVRIGQLVLLLDPLGSAFVHGTKRHRIIRRKLHGGRDFGKSFECITRRGNVAGGCSSLSKSLQFASAFTRKSGQRGF